MSRMGALRSCVIAGALGAALASPFLSPPTQALAQSAPAPTVTPAHGIAMHGDLKYGPGFAHFDYVNPEAPKGGTLRMAGVRTFDTLNPYTLRGVSAAGSDYVFETLMTASADEPFSEYGLLAETIEVPEDRSWVVFNLRPEARFHDGKPVTAEDVVWTFETLMTKGHPRFRLYWGAVDKATAEGPRRVRFTFKGGVNRELPLIIGQLPVLPKHYWADKDFEKTTMTPLLGSGPYRVSGVDPGRSVTLERVNDYWGRDIAVNRGRYNFDNIRIDYYRDATVALEALKAGNFDFREEHVSKFWAASYDVPAVREGFLRKLFLEHHQPTGMQAYVFNTRKDIFSDRRVREALAYAFDFAWTNEVLFFGAYARTESYFSNSDLAAEGLPNPDELAIIEPYRDRLPPEVFTRPYKAPATDGTHLSLRRNLLKALDILKEAGWVVKDGLLVNSATGRPMRFEVLLANPSFERIVLPFLGNLKRLGINATVRTVDASQYINRRKTFDFDMLVHVWGQSLSPGNEQRDYWQSDSAKIEGSYNLAGIRDPVVDKLIDGVVAAKDRRSLVAHTRALDRVLLWGHYVIPHWHIKGDRLAFWDKFGRPEVTPLQGYQIDAWWVDPAREARLNARQKEVVAAAVAEKAATDSKEAPADAAGNGKATRDGGGLPWGWILAGGGAVLIVVLILRRRRRGGTP
ncbi:MAG: extracellular solute-binding protein [Alphaproteobacteria bacterium]